MWSIGDSPSEWDEVYFNDRIHYLVCVKKTSVLIWRFENLCAQLYLDKVGNEKHIFVCKKKLYLIHLNVDANFE